MLRPQFLDRIEKGFRATPVVALLGPRQCGKTTLARQFEKKQNAQRKSSTFFDLEDPTQLASLETPKLTLETLQGLVVIDEVQRRPDLFPVLRVLVDRPRNAARFLILGSASRDLLRQSSETLAGRISFVELTPFNLGELKAESMQDLWLRGGFPRSIMAANLTASVDWRRSFLQTFLERDIPALGFGIPPNQMRRVWTLLSHYHAQILNASELGNALQLSHTTVRRYLDVLTGTFMVRELKPWWENMGKRQVKAPKIYLRDSGLLHLLLDIKSQSALRLHPKVGASWEGFALEEVVRLTNAEPEETYFWASHQGAELDLMIVRGDRRWGFEFKYSDAPKLTPSMRQALSGLHLSRLYVVHPGSGRYSLSNRMEAVGLLDLLPELSSLLK